MLYRTPDARFADLPGYPFAPTYLTLRPLAKEPEMRVHLVDVGPRDASETVVCLHGEPTWSYLYRDVIHGLSDTYRVVAPDFVGFGRSDKLTEMSAYSLDLHLNTLAGVMDAQGLDDVTLVVQDWGGLVGLTYAARHPERVRRLVVMNTFLPTGDEEPTTAFKAWQRFVKATPDLPVGRVVRRGLANPDALPDAVEAAYDAPFPTKASKAGAAVWPLLVPTSPDDPVADAMRDTRERLSDWTKPAFVLFAPDDPILGPAHCFFRTLFPTASEQPEVFIQDASHFLQEEQGSQIAEHIDAFVQRTP